MNFLLSEHYTHRYCLLRTSLLALLFFFLLLLSTSSVAQLCPQAKALKAEYQIITQKLTATSIPTTQPASALKATVTTTTSFELIRHQQLLIHHYPEQNMSYQWYQRTDGKLALTRFFSEQKRGIEYQPNEYTDTQSWQDKFQLISHQLLTQMSLVSESGQGCSLSQQFTYQVKDITYKLTWYPNLALVAMLEINRPKEQIVWQLINRTFDKTAIQQQVALYQQFDTVDYADIGDNESDEFLAKMIHQGFHHNVTTEHGHHH